jgi:hypothetical protein
MRKQCYPNRSLDRKKLPILPPSALLTIGCHDCKRTLAELETAGIPVSVTVPASFCLCGMENADLMALACPEDRDAADVVWHRFQFHVEKAVMLVTPCPELAQACSAALVPNRETWEADAQEILAARRRAFVAELQEQIAGGTYHILGDKIAARMLARRRVRRLVTP